MIKFYQKLKMLNYVKEKELHAYWVNTSLTPLNKISPAFIFEFKVSKTIKGLNAKAEEALKQIKEKKYDVGLKEKGISKVYRIGIAFKGKNVKVKYEIA